MPTSKELRKQMLAMHPLPRQKSKYDTCRRCGGTGHIDSQLRCPSCYGDGKAMQYIPFTAEEQAIWDQYYAIQKEWLRAQDEEKATRTAIRESFNAFRRFQVSAQDPENGESLYVTVEAWLDETGTIQIAWEEENRRNDVEIPEYGL